MSVRITLHVPNQWFEFFTKESERTNVSIAELVRRPLPREYPLDGRRTNGIEIDFSIRRRRIFGWRSGVPFDRTR